MARSQLEEDDLEPPPQAENVSRKAVLNEVGAVHAQADRAYAGFSCPASAECCQLTKTGRQPWLWPSEWLVLKEFLSAAARSIPSPRADGACPFLDPSGARCTVYAARPLGCRTFYCERAHRPRPEPAGELARFFERLERISLKLEDAPVPRPLLDWLRQAQQKV